MTANTKIQATHLARQACVYIRQSSLRQVTENLESQDLQYRLSEQAVRLGWSASQVRVIDDDLGKSGVSTLARQGFQDLAAAIGLSQVGLILVTDVSRLARNCADWYQLLDLAAHFDVLIRDASGLYDPRSYDDRLLLGLKGTFSEIQWHQLLDQLGAARLNKARRGELRMQLPVGLEYQADGQVVKTPDSQVQETISLVFVRFRQLGSVGKLLRWMRDHAIQLPRRGPDGPVWQRPSYQVLYQFLKQPAYAGAYAYGKLERHHLPGQQGSVRLRKRELADWPVLIQDAYPAYLSWQDSLQNQEKLAENAQGASWSRGAPRPGAALLQGIAVCGRCGRKLHVHYHHASAYVCDAETRQHAGPRCQTFNLAAVDPLISQLVLEAVQPAHLEAALAALNQLDADRAALQTHWQQRLERARYAVQLSRRRYQAVDPENRLVAAKLEQAWEADLLQLAQLEKDWQTFENEQLQPLASADCLAIRQLAQDLPALWQASSTSQQDRKLLSYATVNIIMLLHIYGLA
jgi:DNA invertase Pin-like site-specific DNA recombinase